MSKRLRECLMIFTRYPVPGTTKTRMIPALGADGAADLQRQMTQHLISKVRRLVEQQSLAVEIRFEGGSRALMRDWLGPSFSYRDQGRGNIGRRMQRALAEGFQAGYTAIVILGSDIPDISNAIILQAFKALQKNRLVLGPADDGGYYLIGMHIADAHRALSGLFKAVNWGTDTVLSQTIAAAERLGMAYVLLDTLTDVDHPREIEIWNRAVQANAPLTAPKRISIIIPTLNEAGVIKAAINRLPRSEQLEIIVVDGSSADATARVARELGVRVLSAAPSKAGQMNAGAAEARGDVLLFLHVDTRLPENFEEKVLAALSRSGFGAGAFSLGIDSRNRGLRFIEHAANWRARLLKMPYGDQALFVARDLFNKIGGFPDYPIMEDFEFIRRLKRKSKIAILPESVQTSPRRWQNLGVFKTWVINQLIVVAYFIGIPPHRLAFWYRREKGKTNPGKFE